MLDILLAENGDLNITEWGDIELTESIRQAVKVRILWFLREWRFAPQNGVPYYEDILVKSPNVEKIRRIFKNEVKTVVGVEDVKNVSVNYDKTTRRSVVRYDLVIREQTYREEVAIDAYLRSYTERNSS